MNAPVEPKVQRGSLAATASGIVLYLLQVYVFKGAVPAGVASLIYAIVPGAVAFVAAYYAPHQARPADAAAVNAP